MRCRGGREGTLFRWLSGKHESPVARHAETSCLQLPPVAQPKRLDLKSVDFNLLGPVFVAPKRVIALYFQAPKGQLRTFLSGKVSLQDQREQSALFSFFCKPPLRS